MTYRTDSSTKPQGKIPSRRDGKSISRVIQQDRTGCGIACVATVARTSYPRVKRMACRHFGWLPDGVFYTRSPHLNRLLENLGCTAGHSRAVRKWESLPDLAIAAINPDRENFNWHWVIFVMDGSGEMCSTHARSASAAPISAECTCAPAFP